MDIDTEIMKIDRRQFIKTSAAAGTAYAFAGGCAHVTDRYELPSDSCQVKRDDKVLFTNVHVVDVKNGRLFKEKNLLVKDEKILTLLYDKEVPNVGYDKLIDCKGTYVMPGLINAHCHITMPCGLGYSIEFLMAMKRQAERNAEECIKHGVTTVRDMMSVFSWLDYLKEEISRDKLIGPDIISSCALGNEGGYLRQVSRFSNKKNWKTVNTPEEARKAVKKSHDEGSDLIKIFQQRFELFLPGDEIPYMDLFTIAAVCDEAAKYSKPVAVHHTEFFGLENGLKGGVSSFEHMVCDEYITDEYVKRLQDSGAFLVPTASVPFSLMFESGRDPHWGKGRIPRMLELRERLFPGIFNEFCEPEIARSNKRMFKKLSDPGFYDKRHFLMYPDPAIQTKGADIGAYNTEFLYNSGVKFGCGNDGGVPFVFPGAMALEMFILEDSGFKTADILKMATINNAEILKIENHVGTVEQGKKADLVFYSNNPLNTVSSLSKPLLVFKKGRLVYRQENAFRI